MVWLLWLPLFAGVDDGSSIDIELGASDVVGNSATRRIALSPQTNYRLQHNAPAGAIVVIFDLEGRPILESDLRSVTFQTGELSNYMLVLHGVPRRGGTRFEIRLVDSPHASEPEPTPSPTPEPEPRQSPTVRPNAETAGPEDDVPFFELGIVGFGGSLRLTQNGVYGSTLGMMGLYQAIDARPVTILWSLELSMETGVGLNFADPAFEATIVPELKLSFGIAPFGVLIGASMNRLRGLISSLPESSGAEFEFVGLLGTAFLLDSGQITIAGKIGYLNQSLPSGIAFQSVARSTPFGMFGWEAHLWYNAIMLRLSLAYADIGNQVLEPTLEPLFESIYRLEASLRVFAPIWWEVAVWGDIPVEGVLPPQLGLTIRFMFNAAEREREWQA